MERPVIREGEQVVLTLLRSEDAEWLWEKVNDRRVMRWLGAYGIRSVEEEREFIRRAYNKDRPIFLVMDKRGERVGVCGVNDYDVVNQTMEIGIWIAPEHQGKGYGGDAVKLLVDLLFEEYPINKLYAFVKAGNIPSIRILEKVGFKREGRLREHIWRKDGEGFADLYVYGILRREWEKVKSGEK